jgi:CCR4-NOT transcriptional complex subunit CAF120
MYFAYPIGPYRERLFVDPPTAEFLDNINEDRPRMLKSMFGSIVRQRMMIVRNGNPGNPAAGAGAGAGGGRPPVLAPALASPGRVEENPNQRAAAALESLNEDEEHPSGAGGGGVQQQDAAVAMGRGELSTIGERSYDGSGDSSFMTPSQSQDKPLEQQRQPSQLAAAPATSQPPQPMPPSHQQTSPHILSPSPQRAQKQPPPRVDPTPPPSSDTMDTAAQEVPPPSSSFKFQSSSPPRGYNPPQTDRDVVAAPLPKSDQFGQQQSIGEQQQQQQHHDFAAKPLPSAPDSPSRWQQQQRDTSPTPASGPPLATPAPPPVDRLADSPRPVDSPRHLSESPAPLPPTSATATVARSPSTSEPPKISDVDDMLAVLNFVEQSAPPPSPPTLARSADARSVTSVTTKPISVRQTSPVPSSADARSVLSATKTQPLRLDQMNARVPPVEQDVPPSPDSYDSLPTTSSPPQAHAKTTSISSTSVFGGNKRAEERAHAALLAKQAQMAALHKPGRSTAASKPEGRKLGNFGDSDDSDEEEEEENDEDDEEDEEEEKERGSSSFVTPVVTPATPASQPMAERQPSTKGPRPLPQVGSSRRTLPVPPSPGGDPQQSPQSRPTSQFFVGGRAPEEAPPAHHQHHQSYASFGPGDYGGGHHSHPSTSRLSQLGSSGGGDRQSFQHSPQQPDWDPRAEFYGHSPAGQPSSYTPSPRHETFINLNEPGPAAYPGHQHDANGVPIQEGFMPHGLLSQRERQQSAKDLEAMARESGAPLVNVPVKPPPPQTGLVGAIASHEREKNQRGGLGESFVELGPRVLWAFSSNLRFYLGAHVIEKQKDLARAQREQRQTERAQMMTVSFRGRLSFSVSD